MRALKKMRCQDTLIFKDSHKSTYLPRKQRGAGHRPECCPGDRRGDRTTSGHVLITIEQILPGQVGQGWGGLTLMGDIYNS